MEHKMKWIVFNSIVWRDEWNLGRQKNVLPKRFRGDFLPTLAICLPNPTKSVKKPVKVRFGFRESPRKSRNCLNFTL